jgi:hypothetical protein
MAGSGAAVEAVSCDWRFFCKAVEKGAVLFARTFDQIEPFARQTFPGFIEVRFHLNLNESASRTESWSRGLSKANHKDKADPRKNTNENQNKSFQKLEIRTSWELQKR